MHVFSALGKEIEDYRQKQKKKSKKTKQNKTANQARTQCFIWSVYQWREFQSNSCIINLFVSYYINLNWYTKYAALPNSCMLQEKHKGIHT